MDGERRKAGAAHRRYEPFPAGVGLPRDRRPVSPASAPDLTVDDGGTRPRAFHVHHLARRWAKWPAFPGASVALTREFVAGWKFAEVAELVNEFNAGGGPPETKNGGIMLQGILTGQAQSIVLLGVALGLFLYFLPSAGKNASGRSWAEPRLTFAQSWVLQQIFPGLLSVHPGNIASIVSTSLLANLGPGWVRRMGAGRAKNRSPGTAQARQTKIYDAIGTGLAANPWFANGSAVARGAGA